MNIFISKNRVVNALTIPISCTAFMLVLFYCVAFLVDVDMGFVSSLTFTALASGFASLYYSNNNKLSLCLISCAVMSNSLLYVLCKTYFGFGTIVILSCVFVLISRKLELHYAFLFCALLGFSLAVVIYCLYTPIQSLVALIASALANKPTLFGVVNNAYSMFFDNTLGDMIYYKSYSGAYFINDEIVSGVKNVFLANPKNPHKIVASFLTGQYFVNIFLPISIYIALFSRLKDNYILPISLSLLLSIFFGNNLLFSTFIFFYNPFIYFAYLGCSLLAFLVPRFMTLSIGFEHNASLIELIKYGNTYLYFFLIALVLCVMTYYACNIVLSKYDLASKSYYPKPVKELVNALGGERNIIKIENARLYVTNPNLIDIIKVDCEIKGNEITLIENDLELLLDYFS